MLDILFFCHTLIVWSGYVILGIGSQLVNGIILVFSFVWYLYEICHMIYSTINKYSFFLGFDHDGNFND